MLPLYVITTLVAAGVLALGGVIALLCREVNDLALRLDGVEELARDAQRRLETLLKGSGMAEKEAP